MRRTLSVMLATAALLAPAGAAFADEPVQRGPGFNASCSNGQGGNGGDYNGLGNTARAAGECGPATITPPADPPADQPALEPAEPGLTDG